MSGTKNVTTFLSSKGPHQTSTVCVMYELPDYTHKGEFWLNISDGWSKTVSLEFDMADEGAIEAIETLSKHIEDLKQHMKAEKYFGQQPNE